METLREKLQGWMEGPLEPILPWLFAIVIIVVGYFAAKLIENLVRKGLEKSHLDQKLAEKLGRNVEGTERGIAKFVFYLLMLFVVVFALGVVGQTGIVTPLRDLLDDIIGFIPKLLGAAAIIFVGWILATLAKNIVEGLLGAANVDERLGLGDKKPVTNSIGMIVFFGIILLMIQQALEWLEMETISGPISTMIDQIFDQIPEIFAGIAIFAIGYLIASIVQKVLANVLASIGTDSLPSRLGYSGGDLVAGKPLSLIISYVVMASILVVVAAQALEVMDLEFISEISGGFVDGYFNILAAIIIFVVAVYVANIVGQLIEPRSPFWAKVARISILVFMGAAALQQADISSLTNETFQTLITAAIIASAFALGVGGAIALGMGGRDKAKEILDRIGTKQSGE